MRGLCVYRPASPPHPLDAEDLRLLLRREVWPWVLWRIGDIGKIIVVKLDGRASKLPGMTIPVTDRYIRSFRQDERIISGLS